MTVSIFDFDRLEEIVSERREAYESAQPFPHIAIDDFIAPDVAEAVLAEIQSTSEGWDTYRHYNESKEAITNLAGMPSRTRELVEALNAPEFVRFVEKLTGVENLIPDPELDGAGLHRTPAGGFLNVHTDFLCHTKRHDWSRQINLLLYFNKGWQPDWNGDLEFWNADMTEKVTSIPPTFNRCVVFHTTATSNHGLPAPLACPPGVERLSIAIYYFRREDKKQTLTSTHYRALPTDSLWKRTLVAIDRTLLHAYSFLRRHTPLGDRLMGRILKWF